MVDVAGSVASVEGWISEAEAVGGGTAAAAAPWENFAGVEGCAGVTPSFWSREEEPPAFFTDSMWLWIRSEKQANKHKACAGKDESS